MSERHFRWKDVGQIPTRGNANLTPKRDFPSKFAPTRDRSMSSDKLFNNSRSRMHSSVEMMALNQSREESFRERHEPRNGSIKKEEKELGEKRTTLIKFPTLELNNQQSNMTTGSFNIIQQSNLIVTELKKEFWAFKQNVLRELERQKELVQKFMKEIVLTMEVEIEKMGKRTHIEQNDSKSVEAAVDNPIKSLEQWKNELKNIKLSSPSDPKSKQIQQPFKFSTAPGFFNKHQIQKSAQILPPPQLPIDMTTFLSNISKLKVQFNEMEQMIGFGVTEGKKGVKI